MVCMCSRFFSLSIRLHLELLLLYFSYCVICMLLHLIPFSLCVFLCRPAKCQITDGYLVGCWCRFEASKVTCRAIADSQTYWTVLIFTFEYPTITGLFKTDNHFMHTYKTFSISFTPIFHFFTHHFESSCCFSLAHSLRDSF